jgi:hypothetical protein
MMKRTGRSSEALSRAVDALVRRGLIEVRDEEGELLETPGQRRRCGGRLYFRVKNVAKVGKSTDRKSEEVESEARSTGYEALGGAAKAKSVPLKAKRLAVKRCSKSEYNKRNRTKFIQKK